MTLLLLLLLLTFTSCQPSLDNQPRFNVYEIEERASLPGTQRYNPNFNEKLKRPRENLALIKRGQEQFEIFCMVCHGRVGDGVGIVTQHGLTPPPTYHSDVLRRISDDEIFKVITNGKGRMTRLGDRIDPIDRWAIVSYIRVLQLSQNASINLLTPKEKEKLGP